MIDTKQLKSYKWVGKSVELPLEQFLKYAQDLGMNYVFINKTERNVKIAEELRKLGYSVVIGYGDAARIKISW